MQYLVYKGDKQWGPYSEENILEYLAGGQFSRTDFCWFEGQADWVPLGSVPQFQKPPPPVRAPPPPVNPPPPSSPAAFSPTERHSPTPSLSAQIKQLFSLILGGITGALVSYPLSYYFQPGALRQKVSLGDYIQHYNEVMADNTLKSTVVGTFLISLIVGGGLGLFIGRTDNKKTSQRSDA